MPNGINSMSGVMLVQKLETNRLLLRPIELGDEALLWPDTADPEISRYMAWEPHSDITQTRKFVQFEVERIGNNKGVTWLILTRQNEFCGIVSVIGLLLKHRVLTYNKAELSYWLNRKSQGKGIMTESIRRVQSFCFDTLKLHKLVVSHFSCNTASEKLILRTGFRYIGEQREEFQKNGTWYNHKCYELLESEYRKTDLL